MDTSDQTKRVGAAHVFARVSDRLEADEVARSLWLKLQQEIASGGISSAAGYLNARFNELSARVTAALAHEGKA
jgi:hypothetical protein